MKSCEEMFNHTVSELAKSDIFTEWCLKLIKNWEMYNEISADR